MIIIYQVRSRSSHILAINDLHGQITEGKSIDNRSVGSARVLSTYLKEAVMRYKPDQTIIALSGDLTGTSPSQSILLNDEPTIIFLNGFASPGWESKIALDPAVSPVIAKFGQELI